MEDFYMTDVFLVADVFFKYVETPTEPFVKIR